jgi:hypothetical protein
MGSIKQNYANNVLTDGKFDATDLDGVIPNTNINDNSIDNVTVFGTAGSGIPAVASDPPSPTVGDTWYNTTTNKFKYAGTGVGSWASGGNMNQGRYYMMGSGISTAALGSGGYGPPASGPSGTSALNESYNGTSWTEVGDLNTARHAGQAIGFSNTANLVFGGNPAAKTVTELWNGSAWTEVNDLNTGRTVMGSAGSTTAGLTFGGNSPPVLAPPPVSALTESWDGTSWTEVNDLNTARSYARGAGIQTSAIFAGGSTTVSVGNVELYNGTSWTETTDINTARHDGGGSGASNTSALIFGGGTPTPGALTNTESWDGSTWTEVNDMSIARAAGPGGFGTSSDAFATGGTPFPGTSQSIATEEWTISPFSAKTVTTA